MRLAKTLALGQINNSGQTVVVLLQCKGPIFVRTKLKGMEDYCTLAFDIVNQINLWNALPETYLFQNLERTQGFLS